MLITTNNRVLGPSIKTQINAAAKKYAAYVLKGTDQDPFQQISVGGRTIEPTPYKDINLGDFTDTQNTMILMVAKGGESTSFKQKYKEFSDNRIQTIKDMGYDPSQKNRIEFSESEAIQYKNKMAKFRFSYLEVHLKVKVNTLDDKGQSVVRSVMTKPYYCLPEEHDAVIEQLKQLVDQYRSKPIDEAKGSGLMFTALKAIEALKAVKK